MLSEEAVKVYWLDGKLKLAEFLTKRHASTLKFSDVIETTKPRNEKIGYFSTLTTLQES